MPSLAREKQFLKSACPESGREAVIAPGSAAAAEHGPVREPLVREPYRPHLEDLEERKGETEVAVQFVVGSSNPEAVGISAKEREVLEVGAEEQVVLIGVVSEQVKGKC